MLCLSRKRYERVIIRIKGIPDITVEWTAMQGGNVRLGFNADPSVAIFREELLERRNAPNSHDG